MKIEVHSIKIRDLDELAWCALCHGKDFLFWANGKVLCFESELYVKSKEARLVVTDCCIADMPEYSKGIRVEGSNAFPSSPMPIAKASATAEKVLEEALRILEKRKKERKK